ncbi:flavodoxin domain-containing protein [Escherichia coli]|uniref:flavodoxin domain-containing protein n=1 Tax=Escherichia coli TaxID=562 RepID=UPI002FCD5E51
MPSAFYSVNLVARKPEKRTPQTNSYARKFLMNSQWRPDRCRSLPGRCVTHVTLVRPFYDQADYEDVRR